MPLRAIAARMGLSKERVRQLQNRALAKLQELLQQRGFVQQPALS
jgi:DNA-directed RNA polymerase sigma subunit (sigma70/sigma32)